MKSEDLSYSKKTILPYIIFRFLFSLVYIYVTHLTNIINFPTDHPKTTTNAPDVFSDVPAIRSTLSTVELNALFSLDDQ